MALLEPSMKITSIVLHSWDDIHVHAKTNWIYRGQRSAKWSLSTSLERCCEREGILGQDRYRLEAELLRDFRRAYHHYSQHIPAAEAVIEWISLMQHHGAPTRLLDWTYSIYVAAYFALESADSDCAVWALNAPWALRKSVARFRVSGQIAATQLQTPTTEIHESVSQKLLFGKSFTKVAVPLSPFRLNERLRTQRGTFLVPGDITVGFMENLFALPGYSAAANVVELVLPKVLRTQALENLYSMNISRRSLFPGLDGYAQSLGVFHPSFRPGAW